MQTIKFRGKSIEHKAWCYGYILCNYNKTQAQILCPLKLDNTNFPVQCVDVDIKTVGQFSGKLDKNKIEIYDGDILKDLNGDRYGVWYSEKYAMFMMTDGNGCAWPIGHLETEVDFEVVGNIYDNSEFSNILNDHESED